MSTNPKVLIIYTGGTIGMINNPITGALTPFKFDNLYKTIPELKQFHYELDVVSVNNPVDSSEMNVENWADIATTIFEKYENYNGFVILHGTDTMAFTASALSFMLQGLKKPVILTGSQLPIGKIRTDGKENLITAIEIAGLKGEQGESLVQEVAIYFENSLFRGNRSSKVSANHFEAFDSPNYRALAIAGINIDVNFKGLYRTNKEKLELFTDFNPNIGLIKLFPSMPIESLKWTLNTNLFKAVVIESFGSGNSFSSPRFYELIKNYISSGGIILNTTQCIKGSVVQGKYETSNMFEESGVISLGDSTIESALTKAMYALNKFDSIEEKIAFLSFPTCGEFTKKSPLA
jgi:L-asparaginase